MIAFGALTLACPNCDSLLSEQPVAGQDVVCYACHSHIQTSLYPAFFRRAESHAHELVVTSEAACFFHADRVAAFACVRCGRFLCPLCRISWAGEDVCASCLEAAGTGSEEKIASSRFHFDSLALFLSTVMLLASFLSIITAPIALGLAIFTYRKECSVAPRSKYRLWLAMLFSLATIIGWISIFVLLYRNKLP